MRRVLSDQLGLLSKCARARSGTAAIEFGIAMPMLLVLLIGLTEVGLAVYQAMQVQDAAEAGAMYASQHPTDTAGITAAVVNATSTAGISASPVPVTFCGCPSTAGIAAGNCTSACANGNAQGYYMTISAQLTHTAILQFPGFPNPLVLKRSSTVRTQ